MAWPAQCFEVFRNRIANGKRSDYIWEHDSLAPPRARRCPLASKPATTVSTKASDRAFAVALFPAHRASLIARIGGGQPTERQALAIDMLLRSQWSVIVAEHDAAQAPDARTRTDAMRVAADARKQVLLWDRALAAAAPPPEPPPPPGAALAAHLAALAARGDAA